MNYWMTKECGVGWDEPLGSKFPAWGVSKSQERLAKKVAKGDTLLHFIDHVNAWAGYSEVIEPVRNNNRDSNADWVAALPIVIPIKPAIWLQEYQCQLTVLVPGLPKKRYERQRAFTAMHPTDASLIIEAIKAAAVAVPQKLNRSFHEDWMIGAEGYYREIVIGQANGNCWLCQENASSWALRTQIHVPDDKLESISRSFLDAAHIVARSKRGQMMPDNLRPLCPNCHRLVDRLSDEQRERLLRSKN